MANNNQKQEISRRKALQILGGSAAPATVAGCLGDEENEQTPEQETTDTQDTTPEEEEPAPEEQDQLEEPPFEEVLEPSYVDEHFELVEDFDSFSVRITSRIGGFNGIKYEGDAHVDRESGEVLAEFDISPWDEAATDTDLTIGFYSDNEDNYLKVDEDSGSTRFYDLDDFDLEDSELEDSVIDEEVLTNLGASLDISPPIEDLETFIQQSNLIYRNTRTGEYEDLHGDIDNREIHVYRIDNFDILEGELRDDLEGTDIRWIQIDLDKEHGHISSFDLRYVEDDIVDYRYNNVIYDVDQDKSTRPSWVTEAEVTLGD